MKFFLFVVAVLIGVWLWRSGRQKDVASKKPPAPPAALQDMVSCALCGLHLPQAESVSGRAGLLYCCKDHRQRAEP